MSIRPGQSSTFGRFWFLFFERRESKYPDEAYTNRSGMKRAFHWCLVHADWQCLPWDIHKNHFWGQNFDGGCSWSILPYCGPKGSFQKFSITSLDATSRVGCDLCPKKFCEATFFCEVLLWNAWSTEKHGRVWPPIQGEKRTWVKWNIPSNLELTRMSAFGCGNNAGSDFALLSKRRFLAVQATSSALALGTCPHNFADSN